MTNHTRTRRAPCSGAGGGSWPTGAAATVALVIVLAGSVAAQRGGGRGQGPPQPARTAAPVDLTGWWVSIVTEDWRFRMVTPAKGDYASVPLSAEGRRVADTWDPSKDGQCDAYGAAGLMRIPGRLHITWQDDNTLKIETDAGTQTRLLHFGAAAGAGAPQAATLQGYSSAQWVGGAPGGPFGGFGGFAGNVAAPAPGAAPAAAGRAGAAPAGPAAAPPAGGAPGAAARGNAGAGGRGGRGAGAPGAERWGVLRVVTNQLKAAWLRKNGVPYSDRTAMTENFIRFADGADEWFTVSTVVEDPVYLNQSFITSTNFKREPDGSKWKPTTCRP